MKRNYLVIMLFALAAVWAIDIIDCLKFNPDIGLYQAIVMGSGYTRWMAGIVVVIAAAVLYYLESRRQMALSAGFKDEVARNTMFEEHPAVMLLIDPATSFIVEANNAACSFYGYPKEQLVGMSITEINTHPTPLVFADIEKAAAKSRGYFEFKHKLASGEIRDVEVFSGPVKHRGKTVLYSLVHDVTERKRMQEALEKSEEDFRLLAENAQDIIAVHDRKGHFVYVNPAGLRFAEMPLEAVTKLSVTDLLSPEEHKAEADRMRKRLAGDSGVYSFEVQVVLPNGKCAYLDINSAGIVRDGRVDQVLIMARDITERKQAEEAVRKSADLFRAIFVNAPNGVARLNMQGEIQAANPAWCKMLGRSEKELIGLTTEPLTHPDDVQITREYWKKIQAGENPGHIEKRYIQPNGRVVWAISTVSISHGPGGTPDYVIAHSLDITERKHAEEERDRFFRLSIDMLCIAGFDGYFRQVNPAWQEALGWTPEEMCAKSGLDFIHPDDREASLAAGQELRKGSSVIGLECRYLCRNGEYKWLSWNLISVSDEELIYGVVRDITEEQAAEDALRESEHRLAALINFQPDATFAISTDHKVIAWNREMERLTGTTADAMLGQGIDKYSPIFYGEARPLLANLALEYNESLTKEYESIQREGETLVAEVYVPRLTPEGVHLWLKARPLRDIRGKLIGAIESLRDVSQSKKAQLALQENEALLRSILVAAPVGIGIVKNRIITWSNQRLQDMLGYSECELQNQSARILYESDAEFRRIADVKHPQVEKLGVGTVETVFLAKDGRKLNIILSSAAITPGYLEQGLVFTVLDVTTSKRAADALREQQATVNAIVETSQDWIWEIELDGKHTYTNPAVREILGYRPEEIIGTSGNDIMHEEDREKALSVLAECGKTLKGWSNLLLRWRHKDGSYRYLESSGVPILNPQGELTGFRGVDRDITERIHSQEALRESEEKFRKLYTKTPAMLHSIDRDGRLVSVSDTWLEKMGYAAEEVIGRKSTEFLTETSREYAKSQVLPRFFETGICTDINYQFVTKTGAVLDVLLSATSERDAAGNVDRSLAIITDITDRKRAEEALNSTLADLNTTLNATADGILAISDQRKVSFLNKRFAELWKIPEAVLASDDDFTLLQFVVNQLSDPNEFIRRIDSLYISSESSFDTLNFKDGRVFERFSFAILGEDGRVSGRVWSFRDVTERKYAEEALRESEEKYRFLVENSQEAILIVQDGLFKFVNPLLCEKVGRTPEELIDKPFIGYVYQDDREFVMSRYLQRMEGENVPISYDFRINSPDGGYFWIHILIAEMMWEGRPATFLTMSDITERKHAEEALRDSEEKYRGLYLAVTGGVLVTDSHGLITHANEAACEILQLPLDGIVGRVMEPSQDWAALDSQGNPMPADDYPPLRAISTREPVRGATMGFTLGDSCEPRWVLVNSEPVLDPVSEEVVSSVTTFVDITRQKLMEEELERASKSLSEKVMELEQFIYTVSHDLRTPLVTMQGFVEVIRKDIDKEAPDSIQDALGRIYRSTQRMDGLLKDLLEMSRIGRVTRKPELVDLCDTMSEILAEVIPADRGYQVDMGHCHCSEPVLYDPVRLHQVLANLLENAVKFTRSTPNPTIRLMCEERGDEVEITIGDNGIGISPQYHDKVFEVFTRLPGAADAPGSGVGLAIVKRIVELHGGRIWVVSDEGKGAEFHFTIKKGGFDDGTQ